MFLTAVAGVIITLAGVLVLPAATAAAATCPTVDPSTGVVSPAPAPGVDWSGCDLTGANLTGANLSDANLSDANLYLAIISSANFTGATLTGLRSGVVTYASAPTLPANWSWISGGYLVGPGADLAGVDLAYVTTLNGTDLTGADLAGVTISGAYLTNVDFTGANLDNATVNSATLIDDTLKSATLTDANLGGSLVENSTLADADLSAITGPQAFTGDDFTNANLTNANLSSEKVSSDNLTGAALAGANLGTAKLTDDNLAAATLTGATLSQVSSGGLTGTPASLPADWSDSAGFLLGPTASLASADLTGANLSNADLSNANLSDATLTGATLTGTNLSDADMDNASSGSLTGKPASLPANWSITSGFLFGPTAGLFGANLTGVSFGNSDLAQANLADAKLADANLGTADLSQADLDGVTSGGVTGGAAGSLPADWQVQNGYLIGQYANLDGANLAGLSLHDYLFDVQLANADLENTNFSSGSLTGAVLSNANLTNANLTDVSLTAAAIGGANFSGVSLSGVVSGQLTGTPVNLPNPWQLLDGYLIGPGANLTEAEFGGATFDNADLLSANLYQADLNATDWSNTICPDGTNSDNDGDTCVNNLGMPVESYTEPVPHPSTAGSHGANGWYTSAVTVTWNWTVSVGQLNPAKCTPATKSTGEGASVTLSASCTSVQGMTGTASQQVRIDTTAPRVLVTGAGNGKVYSLGNVPAPGCRTTDSVSGVATAAKVAVTGASSHGTGSFTATCAGAVNKAGIAATPVTVHYSVGYRFGGFATPRPGSTLPKSARTIAVEFRLANATGHAIPASWAAALAKAGQVRVTLTGPGISRVTAVCAWKAATGYFQCSVKVPSGIKAGKSFAYAITARERLGTAFAAVPATGKTASTEAVHFR
ncbi:MAG: pentapeptide repeat-containing protein [Trebonia sp.]